MRALALLLIPACTIPIVSTDRARIDWVRHGRHGNYEKLGVPLEGTTCGDEYMHAVAGVPQAEDLMTRCYNGNLVFGAGMLGFIAFPVAGIVTGLETTGTARDVAFSAGIGVGVASFAIGFAAAVFAAHRLDESVHAYNAAVDTSAPQR